MELMSFLVPQQIRRAFLSERETAEKQVSFWVLQLTGVQNWMRVAEVRVILECVVRAAYCCDMFDCILKTLSTIGQFPVLDLPSVVEVGWSAGALVPAFLFFSSVLLEQRKRISGWVAAHPWLSLALLISDSRSQAVEWREAGRTDQRKENIERFTIFQWAFVCEQAPDTTEPLVLYWQMFFLLYFERSALGKVYAIDYLTSVDPLFRSRLAASLEQLSARTGSAIYNAMALWLRFDGASEVLLDNYNGLPNPYLGKQLLARIPASIGVLNSENADQKFWKDLLKLQADEYGLKVPANQNVNSGNILSDKKVNNDNSNNNNVVDQKAKRYSVRKSTFDSVSNFGFAPLDYAVAPDLKMEPHISDASG